MMKPSFSWLKTRQTKYGLYLTAYILVVLALLAVANWAVNRHSKSWDLTANKQYSLSEQTRKIVRGLNRDVKIYYVDKEGQFGRAKDLLGMYDQLSRRISVEYLNPDKKPAKANEVKAKSYGSIILVSGDRRQEASVLDEESVTTALIRVIKSGEKNVCFVDGHGEMSLEDSDRRGLSRAKKALEDSNYKTKTVSLLRDPKVPADCTVTVIDGPKNEYVDTEVDGLRKYVEGGGRVFFLLEPATSEKLGELLASWNVVLKKDLIIDLNPVNQLFGAEPTMPIIVEYKSHTITREMARVATIMPFARSVAAGKDSKAGITVETLYETSAESWSTKFSPEMKQIALERGKDNQGPISVAVAGTVKKTEGAETKEGRLVVVGSARFPANNYIGFNGNKDLFVNTVNWLSSDEDLISIRPKDPENRRINLTRAQMSRVVLISLVGLPLLMVCSGVVVWWKRR
jgi:ABC-type uncharacterized transport system involved in gliding motility auxiliary subunit